MYSILVEPLIEMIRTLSVWYLEGISIIYLLKQQIIIHLKTEFRTDNPKKTNFHLPIGLTLI